MKGLALIKSTREYLNYLEEHLLNVRKAWSILQSRCKHMRFVYEDFFYNTIGTMIEDHDLSKFGPYEFTQYRDKFFPTGTVDVGTINDRFAGAWEHHKKHNPHHWENWTVRDTYYPHEWEMHCVCMVADWMAMGMKFGDTAEEYYRNNQDKISLPDYAVDFVNEIFECLRKDGDNG